MKKKAIILALCVCMLTACGGNAESTTTSAEQTSGEVTTAEITTEITTESTTESTTETTEAAPDDSSDDLVTKTITLPDGTTTDVLVDMSEGSNKIATVDAFYGFVSSGFEDDSAKSPDLFDVENYGYNGDAVFSTDVVKYSEGDTVKGCAVTEAKTDYAFWSADGTADVYESVLQLEGEITMDGYLVYAMEDDYGVSVGDIAFIPSAAELGDLPIPFRFYGNTGSYVIDGDFGYCGDTISISLGNILTGDYDSNQAVADKVDRNKKLTRVKATIESVRISFTDNFGDRNTAVLKDFEVIS